MHKLGTQSHVKVSFEMAEYMGDVDVLGMLCLLNAIQMCGFKKLVEKTLFDPHSPHGVTKMYGYWIMVNYREAYGMYACDGILFNHESPPLGRTFVPRKISRTAAQPDTHLGKQKSLYLSGQLESLSLVGRSADLSLRLPVRSSFSGGTTTSTVSSLAPPTLCIDLHKCTLSAAPFRFRPT